MDDVVFIYRNRSDDRFYDAATGETRGGPDKAIVYINGLLCAMDREARITIPVSRWKLARIGLACFMTALGRKGANIRSVEPIPAPRQPPEALPEPPPEATVEVIKGDRSEDQWERLIKEMRDLSR
jgi:hypothetical protein